MALLVIVLLAVIVGELSYSSSISAKIERNASLTLQNAYAAFGALNVAKALLLQDLRGENELDSLSEEWARPVRTQFGDSEVTIEIVDEAGKLNPNSLDPNLSDSSSSPPNELQKLVDALGIRNEHAGLRVADWIDQDETGLYERGAANRRLASLAEVLRIPHFDRRQSEAGMSPEELAMLVSHLTIWSDGKVNLNTASESVLAALLPRDAEEIAARIVGYREEQDFEKVSDVQRVEGFSGIPFAEFSSKATTRSNTYRADITVTRGTATMRASAVLRRTKDTVETLLWNERAEFTATLQ